MRRYTRTLISTFTPAVAAALGACGSVYTNSARQLAFDDRSRFELRVLEARQTAAAAEQLLLSQRPALEGESWEESVDECRWELQRRVESAHDAAARLANADTAVHSLLAALDTARTDLDAAAARGPGALGKEPATQARASLGAAVASVDTFLRAAREGGTPAGASGNPAAASPAPH